MGALLASTKGEGYKNLLEMMTVFETQIEKKRKDFTDTNHATFIVAIKQRKNDCHNIVINQVLFANKKNDNCDCDMCKARFNIQSKYIKQIHELYRENEEDNYDDVNMNEINDENKINGKFFISILTLQEEEWNFKKNNSPAL